MNEKEYQNIDCGLYDQYVLHAMRKTNFRYGEHEEVQIKDLLTENGKEFMILSNGLKVRLDKVEISDHQLVIR